MSKRYKELPAFETNEFKVGDLINNYASTIYLNDVWIVQEIRGNLLLIKNEKESSYLKEIHFKACRKLEKLKPREWEVYEFSTNEVSSRNMIAPSSLLLTPGDTLTVSHKKIKVREVLDEE